MAEGLAAVRSEALSGMGPADLTPAGIGRALAAPAARSLRAATPEVRRAAGLATFALAWPAWRMASIPGVAAILVRLAVEMALALLLGPMTMPLVRAVIALLRALLSGPPVRSGAPWAAAGPDLGAALTGLFAEVDRLRADPRTCEWLDAAERLLATPPESMSGPARVGLGLDRE